MLNDLFQRLRYGRAIRAAAVTLYIEQGGDAVKAADETASDPSTQERQKWFRRQVRHAVERLEADMRGMDTATKYIEYARLEAEYRRIRRQG